MKLSDIKDWLFGTVPHHGGRARGIGTALIDRIVNGGLRGLDSDQLMQLVNFLLTTPQLRRPLRGNARFLQSVSASYSKKNVLSAAQRQAILNILERAYPHNLAAELNRFA